MDGKIVKYLLYIYIHGACITMYARKSHYDKVVGGCNSNTCHVMLTFLPSALFLVMNAT
jgi:hypothetical protein